MAKSIRIYYNNAKTTISSSIGAGDTTIPVVNAALFSPAPISNQHFLLTLDSGTAIEIIEVHGISGNNLLNCVRGVEGTTAQSFSSGTRAENRVTAGTLASFSRYQDVLAPVTTLDQLNPPFASDGNSYLCSGTLDDSGNPVVAVIKGGIWRFPGYPTLIGSGTLISDGTTTSAVSTAALAVPTVANAAIIQFTSGNNAARPRMISSVSGTQINWAEALASPPLAGDTFEIYQSATSSIAGLQSIATNSLIYSIIFSD